MSRLALPVVATLALTALAAVANAVDGDPFAGFSPRLGGDGTREIAGEKAFTFPVANLQAEHTRPFFFGNRLFNTNWVQAPGSVRSFDGLGPIFNRASCAGCHTRDGRGQPPEPGGPMRSMLIRLSVPTAEGGFAPHPVYGDQLGEEANPGVAPEGRTVISYREMEGRYGDGEAYTLAAPQYQIADPGYGPLGEGLVVSPRVAPQVIGLGLLEAVDDADILARADPDDRDADGISGRPNFIGTGSDARLGRFGWKANQPDLRSQNAGAAIGDIGLTSPVHGDENCSTAQSACLAAVRGDGLDLPEDFLERMTLYTRLLAVPAQRMTTAPNVRRGRDLFAAFGCAACHVPTLQTTGADLPELAGQTFHPFTDLLLHDMGEGLADGRPDHLASGREWRTPPLWGLGLVETVNRHNRLLHDGRARGFAEAVLWHGGEAEGAREAFRLAGKADREALIAFLRSL